LDEGEMSFTDLIDLPFSSHLKKLFIDDEYQWIQYPEPGWVFEHQFPSLECDFFGTCLCLLMAICSNGMDQL
jgi:hypothetical protein